MVKRDMKLSIVIPSYNESYTLETVVRELCEKVKTVENSFEVIMVDNGSTDTTPDILAALTREIPQLRVLKIFPNKGYGNGILQGLGLAAGEILGWMHADSQVNPDDCIKVLEKLRNGNYGLCKVTRITREEPMVRIVLSALYNKLFKLFFGSPCSDVNASPKFFLRELYEKAHLQSRDWFIDAEIAIKAVKLGYEIGEVPIVWRTRPGGASKVTMWVSLEFLKNMIIYRFFQKH